MRPYMKKTFQRRVFLAVALSIGVTASQTILTPSLFAQNNVSGDITGSVTDPTGALISGAKVTIKNTDTGATQVAITNNSGNYRASLLKPGPYTLVVTREGFETVSSTVNVTPGTIAQADIKLPVGSSSTRIEVTEAEPLLHTENADLSTTFTQQQVQDLPNPGNDLTFIAQTSPGAVMNTQGGYGNFSVFGLPATSNTFTVNGGYENDPFLNLSNSGASNLLLGNNDVGEVTVTSNAFSAQFGGLGASQVSEISRSGTNRFHGDATWWWNGSSMNGNDYFNNQTGTKRPRSNANQWAGAFGGPIYKDKTFFFFNTEGLRVIIPTRGTVYAPSSTFIASTLANVAPQGPAAVAFYQGFFNQYTSMPAYATGAPSTTDLDALGNPNTVSYNANGANFAHEWLITARVDHKISDKDTIFVHYKQDKGVQPTFTSLINPLFNAASPQPEYEGQLNETHIFTPNVTNQFVLAAIYYRALFSNTNQAAAGAIAPFGIQFNSGDLANNTFNTTPGGEDFEWTQGRNVTGYQVVDDFSITRGRHTIKIGGALRRDDVTDYGPGVFLTPLIVSSEASFNAGTADAYIQQFPLHYDQPVALYTLGFYAQDQWKLAPNFTLNFGMRFEHNSNPICKTNCFSVLAGNFASVSNSTAAPYNTLINSGQNSAFPDFQKVSYEPRVGFSWSPLGAGTKTVLRGGFGMFSDSFPAQITDSLLNNAPTNVGFTLLGPANGGPASPIFQGAAGPLPSFQNIAAGSNAGFQAAYHAGGSNDSISASVPNFASPGFVTTVNKLNYPTYEEYSLQLEQQVTQTASVTVAYVGNHGYHEPVNDNNVNAYNPGGVGFASLPTSVPNANFSGVTQVYTGATSNYNGVTFTATNRMKLLTLQLNYTYSHALDEISNGGFNGFSGNSINPENSANLAQNYGNADYDTRHYVSGNYIFNLPAYRGPGFLTKGWEAAGTVFHSTGLPFTFTDATTNGTLPFHSGPLFAQQTVAHLPTKCSGGNILNLNTATGTNCAASLDVTNATDFGQQERNQSYGPSYTDTDLTITKTFAIPVNKGFMEDAKLKLGVQMFNLFNHPNFAQPSHDVSACTGSGANPCTGSTIGTISGTVNPPTSILGSFLGGDASPRLIQVKANFSF
jgi:hypothetical protein